MRARPRRLPRGSRRGFLRDETFSRLGLLWAAVHPIRRHYTLSDRVHRDVTGVSRRNGCSASCTAFVKQAWSVTERNCPQLCLLWGVVHPIRRHYTPSDRVQRDGTGAALHSKCSAYRVQCSPHPCARAGATCVNGAALMRRRTTSNRGGTQAVWLGSLLLLYTNAARSSRGCCDDRRVHQMRSVVTD